MRPFLGLLLTAVPLYSQSTDSDRKTLDALLSEVRELRLSIERSTLLGTRTQLAISQLQLDEAASARIEQQLNAVRNQEPGPAKLAKSAEQIKLLEEALNSPENAAPPKHTELEAILRGMKLELEHSTALEQQRAARESELITQLRNSQAQAADSRNRITQMEQSLDAAIQQLLKPH
jgi:hypothetical protein